jgi:hypothetical protein
MNTLAPFNTPTTSIQFFPSNLEDAHQLDRKQLAFLARSLTSRLGSQTLLSADCTIRRLSYGFPWFSVQDRGLQGRSVTLFRGKNDRRVLIKISID